MIDRLLFDAVGFANHSLPECIGRYTHGRIPVHIAVHDIDVDTEIDEYCDYHKHDDADELNIIIGELTFDIVVDGVSETVSGMSTVWIPAGVYHSANVIDGNGYFVCLRFPKT